MMMREIRFILHRGGVLGARWHAIVCDEIACKEPGCDQRQSGDHGASREGRLTKKTTRQERRDENYNKEDKHKRTMTYFVR